MKRQLAISILAAASFLVVLFATMLYDCGQQLASRHFAARRVKRTRSNFSLNSACSRYTTNGDWGSQLLRCGLYVTAGFGVRFQCLNGCLLAANDLGLTLIYHEEFYEYKKYIGNSSTADELLHLADALPTSDHAKQCFPDISEQILVEMRNVTEHAQKFESVWPTIAPGLRRTVAKSTFSSHESSSTTVFDLRAGETSQDSVCLFYSYDFSSTAPWFRTALARSAFLGGTPAHLTLFRPDKLNVAIHVRNGDRLPGRSYERSVHKNLPDDYYLAVVSQIAIAAASLVPPRPLHVVAFGASLQPSAQQRNHGLVDALGNLSIIPSRLDSINNVETWRVRVDGDWKSDLAHMATADVLVAARSAFSRVAAVLSSSVIIDPPGHKNYTVEPERQRACHVTAQSDGMLDATKLMQALSDTTCRARQNVSSSMGL